MDNRDEPVTLAAAADALAAARAVIGHLGSVGFQADTPSIDLDDLIENLAGPAALDASTRDHVAAGLAHVEERISAGTEYRTEWMPKACCGDDVTEWEPWARTVRSPEAIRLLGIAEDLRHFSSCGDRVRDLVAAERAVEVLRSDRS